VNNKSQTTLRVQRAAAGSQRRIVDVYCGVIAADVWPFGEPLVVELEIERGSFVVLDVHVSANLPGLRRHLRRLVRGIPVSEIGFVGENKGDATYYAPYWKWIRYALVFAIRTFKEERREEYWTSLYHVRRLRDGVRSVA
jgi:hypothetical protein